MAELGHFLYRYERTGPKNVSFHIIRELSAQEYELAGKAINTVSKSLRGMAGWGDLAQADLDSVVEDLKLRGVDRLRRESDSWLVELQYRVVAVSAAIRMHEEHVLAEVRRRHGKGGPEEAAARQVFSSLYDGSFAYRVIYYLRNALVHGSQGLVRAFAKSSIVPDLRGGERTATVVELQLDRAAVKYSGFKAALRDQIARLPDDPDLVPMCRDAVGAINSVRGTLDSILNPDLNAAVELIRGYMNEAAPFGDGPHFHEHEVGDPFASMTMLGMNDAVGRYVFESSNKSDMDGFPPE